MTPSPSVRILVVATLAVLGLVGLVIRESLARAAGVEVVLAMQGVDPRTTLSGNYVAISLRETLPIGQACPPGFSATDAVRGGFPFAALPPKRWVAMARRGDHDTVVGVAGDRAAARRYGPVVARGAAWCEPPWTSGDGQTVNSAAVSLDLGVDRFHIGQAEAERIGALVARHGAGAAGPVAAIVSVDADGQARLKGLLVEGRRFELELL